jgi:hypothetical protein
MFKLFAEKLSYTTFECLICLPEKFSYATFRCLNNLLVKSYATNECLVCIEFM